MNMRDQLLFMAQNLFEALVQYLDFFGNEPLALFFAFAAALFAAILGSFLARGVWVLLRRIFSGPAIVTEKAELEIDGQMEEKGEMTAQFLKSHADLCAGLARIETAMSGLIVKMNKGRAQAATIEEKLEALGVLIGDLTERLATDGRGTDGYLGARVPPEKFSAEIADIVRELQEA